MFALGKKVKEVWNAQENDEVWEDNKNLRDWKLVKRKFGSQNWNLDEKNKFKRRKLLISNSDLFSLKSTSFWMLMIDDKNFKLKNQFEVSGNQILFLSLSSD